MLANQLRFCVFKLSNFEVFLKKISIRHFLRLTPFYKLVYDKNRLAKEAEQKVFVYGNRTRSEWNIRISFSGSIVGYGDKPAWVPDAPSIFSAQPPNERAPVREFKSALPVSVMI
ncbi:hypothetical protein ASD24_09165 [Paenibacillus sp. Root52]|nr:hypothetical protein ASD24_09165 [Paenibacillus sp. Root52]